MIHFFKKFFGVLFCALFMAHLAFAQEAQPPREWLEFVDGLKKEMIAKGISKKTIKKAYGTNTYYHPKPEVVAKDEKQTEFVLTTKDYLNVIVSEKRVQKARQHYQDLKKEYDEIEKKYGVPINYLTAFWAVETNFGQNKGKYHLIDALTNLSYKNRRSAFFKNELYNVLKIMDQFELKHEKMLGSWAGAMGHFQFMPSTYSAYAVDYDGDGVADIWDSFDDAIASAANYLHDLGFKKDEPWGTAVELPWNFDYRLAGYKTRQSVSKWTSAGVRDKHGNKLKLNPDLNGSIIVTDGRKGQAYLVFSNFRRIMIWNRSENYALAIGVLADYIGSDAPYKPAVSNNFYALTSEDILKIQKFANKVYRSKLKEDGKFGSKTKEAVVKIQKAAKLPEDGYPSYQLLQKIENYNPKVGFSVPVQPKKKSKMLQK
ncbi:MAG: lytic murein transglycosylase [Alphaproteobacteria bacterium]|nr:lytic murein transglycosylase [Alphaproteobacteria bacterium]